MPVLPLSAARGLVLNVFKSILGIVSGRNLGIGILLATIGLARSHQASAQVPFSTTVFIEIANITDQEITNVCVYKVLSGQISIEDYDDCVYDFGALRRWYAFVVAHQGVSSGPSFGSPGIRRAGAVEPFASSSTSTFTPALVSSVPALPFLGNQLTVLSWIPGSTTGAVGSVAYEAGLARQSDCSLDEVYVQPNSGLPDAEYLTALTSAQDFIHKLAGLTTTADVFANGCAPQVLGMHASTGIQSLGQTSDGAAITAVLASAGVYVTVTDTTANTSKTTQVTSGSNPGAFYAASLRKNGIMDLVETGLTDPANSSPATAVLLGNGDGTFQTPVYYDVSANSNATAAGFTVDDVTGDGVPDIVILNGTMGAYNGTVIPVTGTVTTLIGKGDGTFTVGPVSSLTWTDSLQVESGVFKTGDVKDLLVGGTVLFGAGSGSFTQGPTNNALATDNFDTAAAGGNAVGSLTSNGKADVVVSVPGFLSIFYGNGDGTFTTGPSYAAGPDFMQATITDIDGDGNPDIVLGTSTGGVFAAGGYDTPIPTFQILMGRGDGTFVDSPVYVQGTYTHDKQIASADFNGDGKTDVLVYDNSTTGPSTLAMLPGDGTGALGTAVTSAISIGPSMLVAAKMTHDTLADAVVAGSGNSGATLAVLTNQGNGTFAAEQDYALAANPVSLVAGDFNGDGLADVAVGVTGGGVYVLFGQANGTLGTPVQVDTSANPTGLAAGALTTDGRTDLVVADQATGALHIYLGNANNTFTAKTAPTGTANLVLAALGDLNNDGKLDLILAGFTPGSSGNPNVANVYTFLGNGDGTFQTANTLAIASIDAAPGSLAVADFNDDGYQDVVIGNSSDYTEVLLSDGDGTLTDTELALGQKPASIAAADLLGNGYPELLVGEGDTDNQGYGLAVFENQGTSAPNLLTTPTVTVSPAPASITTAESTMVTVTVAGSPTPTGTVILSSGLYASAAMTLSSGSTVITVPGSALDVAADTLTATYTPDTASASIYNSASGTGSVTVTAAVPTFALSNSGNISFTAGATTGNTATITATPAGGFTGAIALSCAVTTSPTGATSPATCAVPASVTISGATAQNATLTVSSTTSTTGGAYAVTVTGTSGAITMTTVVNITVAAYVAPSFALTNSGALTISAPGASTGNTATITVTPSGGFTGAVTLTAVLGNSPSGATDLPTFSFGSTLPVNITSGAETGTLTVSTTAPTTGALSRPEWRSPWTGVGGAVLALVWLFGIRRRRWIGILGALVLFALSAGAISGCGGSAKKSGGGGSSGGTTAGSYTVTVTGTSGSTKASTTVSFTVD